MTMSCNMGTFAMPANQIVQARIDRAVKEEAATVLAAMGLTVSDATEGSGPADDDGRTRHARSRHARPVPPVRPSR